MQKLYKQYSKVPQEKLGTLITDISYEYNDWNGNYTIVIKHIEIPSYFNVEIWIPRTN